MPSPIELLLVVKNKAMNQLVWFFDDAETDCRQSELEDWWVSLVDSEKDHKPFVASKRLRLLI